VVALGTFGGPGAVEALKFALHQGDFWSPLATRRLRSAAAQALRRIGTPAALEVLREALLARSTRRQGGGTDRAVEEHLITHV
jgi:HEAT repeat protein